MRPDHLTFLVLAGAVALVAFALGGVPALLLPPALHSATRIGENGAQTRAEARRGGKVPGEPRGRAGGALAHESRAFRRQRRGLPRHPGAHACADAGNGLPPGRE